MFTLQLRHNNLFTIATQLPQIVTLFPDFSSNSSRGSQKPNINNNNNNNLQNRYQQVNSGKIHLPPLRSLDIFSTLRPKSPPKPERKKEEPKLILPHFSTLSSFLADVNKTNEHHYVSTSGNKQHPNQSQLSVNTPCHQSPDVINNSKPAVIFNNQNDQCWTQRAEPPRESSSELIQPKYIKPIYSLSTNSNCNVSSDSSSYKSLITTSVRNTTSANNKTIGINNINNNNNNNNVNSINYINNNNNNNANGYNQLEASRVDCNKSNISSFLSPVSVNNSKGVASPGAKPVPQSLPVISSLLPSTGSPKAKVQKLVPETVVDNCQSDAKKLPNLGSTYNSISCVEQSVNTVIILTQKKLDCENQEKISCQDSFLHSIDKKRKTPEKTLENLGKVEAATTTFKTSPVMSVFSPQNPVELGKNFSQSGSVKLQDVEDGYMSHKINVQHFGNVYDNNNRYYIYPAFGQNDQKDEMNEFQMQTKSENGAMSYRSLGLVGNENIIFSTFDADPPVMKYEQTEMDEEPGFDQIEECFESVIDLPG